MKSVKTLVSVVGVVVISTSMGFFIHPDDPKIRDAQPRYEGPGYRRDANMPQNPHGFDAQNVELLSWLPISEFGNHSSANDCWGYVSDSGNEYAIIGLSAGTGFVDITNPGNAQVVAVLPGPGDTTWRDIKIYQQYAYAVSEAGDGIQVFDLSQIDSGTVTHVRNITTGGSTASHNVALNEDSGYLYRTGGSGHGLRIYDLANPTNPVYVTTFSDRYVHDAQIVTYTDGPYAGREIAFCCAGFNNGWDQTGLWIVDVTDKQNIFTISHTEYSNNAYSHQGWLSADKTYFYQNDELDEDTFGHTTLTRVFDVRDLSSPSLVSDFTSGVAAIDHNLYVRDNLIFEANYRSGLRVFDATNPTAPVQIGYFDTYPNDDSANFNGLWSNYPFFPSGTIIGSDRERGLFVWSVEIRAIEFEFSNSLPDVITPEQSTEIEVAIRGANGNDLDPDTPLLWWRIGDSGEFTADPLAGLGGDLYQALLPAIPCGEVIQYYFSAETTLGEIVTSPSDAPQTTYQALAIEESTYFTDDFESDQGWTVENVDLEDGQWTRGVPVNGQRGDPPTDYDGSGMCYITDNVEGDSDVDGGPTMLISPLIDLSAANESTISYARWFSNDDGDDSLDVHISNNDGSSWVLVESIGNTGGWSLHSFRVADFLSPTSQMRLRFSAADNPNDSVTEAGVDAIVISTQSCGEGGETTIIDFSIANGTLLDGTTSDLLDSDDLYVHTQSGFGETLVDLHNMEMVVSAATTVGAPSTLDLTIESRIDEPSGIAQIRLRNWNSGQYESVGQYAIGNADQVDAINGIDATVYVNTAGAGEIDMSIKHIVFVPFLAFTFESFVDQIQITVN